MAAESAANVEAPGRALISAGQAARVGWVAFGAGLLLRLVGLWLTGRLGARSVTFALGIGPWTFVAAILLGTAAALVGAIIVARRPDNVVGWIYVLTGALQAVITTGLAYAGLEMPAGPNAVAVFFVWVNGVVDFAVPFSLAALVLGLFPDGRFVGPRWRIIGLLAVVGGIISALEVGFGASSLVLIDGYPNPYEAGGAVGPVLVASSRIGIGSFIVEAAAVIAAASLAVRYRRSDLDGRRQIRWILLAGSVAVLSSLPLVYQLLVPSARRLGFDALAVAFVSLCLAPIATLLAITRYRLYQIDRILNRALVYGSLTAILAGSFTAAVGLAQRLFVFFTGESSDAAIVLTTLVVATAYAPLRKRLERLVDRHFKYERPTFGPYRDELTSYLSLRDPGRAAERLAREAVAELQASGAAVLSESGAVTAEVGRWRDVAGTRLPIPGGVGPLATVVAGPRGDGSPLDPERIAALTELAALVAEAARPPGPRR